MRRTWTALAILALVLGGASLSLALRSYWLTCVIGCEDTSGSWDVRLYRGFVCIHWYHYYYEISGRPMGWFYQFNAESKGLLLFDSYQHDGTNYFEGYGFRVWAWQRPEEDRHFVVFPAWLLVVLSLASFFPFWRLARRALRHQRLSAGLCPTCGYDLRASKNRCPECGSPMPPSQSKACPE